MKIERDEHGRKGAFFIENEGEWIAELTYFRSGENKITIDHTEVDPEYRKKGLGKDLVRKAAEFAEANNLKIKATCPFAREILINTPDFHDVLLH